MVAGCYGYRSIFIPAMQLWCAMLPDLATPRFHEDNQAMIFVVVSGRNPTMIHIGRVHGVSVHWLNDRLGNHKARDRVHVFYQDTRFMSADIYTKAFSQVDDWVHARKLISVFAPD